MKKKRSITRFFDRFSSVVTRGTGKPAAFILSVLVVLTWAVTGPLFHYSVGWQLTINTATTIITFLMVFVIQQTQNKEGMALQLKLNELIAVIPEASNRLVDIEDLTEEEIRILKKFYVKLADLARAEKELHTSHSIDEAKAHHEWHERARRKKKEI